jgi:NAD(P)-dependent dehydrogenase (short-subunit alcohol dehydrogenase family)
MSVILEDFEGSSLVATRPRTIVITGATSGIGRVAAIALADARTNLVLTGRNARRGQRLASELVRRRPGVAVEFVAADLSRQADVQRLASSIISGYQAVDVLINNAGARVDRYQRTEDGLESTFATNHVGHFLLTCLLAERLAAAQAARVISVSSSAHLFAPSDPVWTPDGHAYDRRAAYATSKLANVLFAYELARRVRGTRITSNAVDPGIVATNFARNNGIVPWLKHLVSHGIRRELISARHGADTLVFLASSPAVEGVSGKYFRERCESTSSPQSHSRECAQELWVTSARLTGLISHQWSEPRAISA